MNERDPLWTHPGVTVTDARHIDPDRIVQVRAWDTGSAMNPDNPRSWSFAMILEGVRNDGEEIEEVFELTADQLRQFVSDFFATFSSDELLTDFIAISQRLLEKRRRRG